MMAPRVFVILDNIRSSENVGSIFRTSDAAGVSKIYLAGYTPAPLDKFKRKNAKLAKAALGAEDTVPWEAVSDLIPLISRLKKEGVTVVAIEQHSSARSYTEAAHDKPVAFVFGNEVEGISEEVIRACDSVVEVPMSGGKESLNVSVCAGIVLFNARDRKNSA